MNIYSAMLWELLSKSSEEQAVLSFPARNHMVSCGCKLCKVWPCDRRSFDMYRKYIVPVLSPGSVISRLNTTVKINNGNKYECVEGLTIDDIAYIRRDLNLEGAYVITSCNAKKKVNGAYMTVKISIKKISK